MDRREAWGSVAPMVLQKDHDVAGSRFMFAKQFPYLPVFGHWCTRGSASQKSEPTETRRLARIWHAQGKSTAACSTPSTAGSRSLFSISA